MTAMTADKFGQSGPSASYAVAYNRVINADGSPEEAHAAGVRAHEASVWGHDAKKDSKGRWIQQGIGSPGHETGNHFAALKKAEQQGLERPGAYEKALREIWKRDPAHAKAINLEQPPRLGE